MGGVVGRAVQAGCPSRTDAHDGDDIAFAPRATAQAPGSGRAGPAVAAADRPVRRDDRAASPPRGHSRSAGGTGCGSPTPGGALPAGPADWNGTERTCPCSTDSGEHGGPGGEAGSTGNGNPGGVVSADPPDRAGDDRVKISRSGADSRGT